MKKRDKILKDLKNVLKIRLGDKISSVILFGSRVNGNPKQYSDYDILIILNSKPGWKDERKISDLCYQIELKYDIITDEHLITENELHSLKGHNLSFNRQLKTEFMRDLVGTSEERLKNITS